MIIRVTFRDNDFKYVLQDLFKTGLWGIFFVRKQKLGKDNTDTGIKTYFDFYKEIEGFLLMIENEKEFSQEQKDRFVELLRLSILDYLEEKYKNEYEYLSKSLDIKLQKSVSDKWENGEVAYYFPLNDTLVIM